MTDKDKYSKLIKLLNEFHDDITGSLTHLNRAKRVCKEIAETNYKLAVLIFKSKLFFPQEEFEELRECTIGMSNYMDEFAEFLSDYGEDLVNIGTDVVNIFEEFKMATEEKNEDSMDF